LENFTNIHKKVTIKIKSFEFSIKKAVLVVKTKPIEDLKGIRKMEILF